jgi:hypothetical protein
MTRNVAKCTSHEASKLPCSEKMVVNLKNRLLTLLLVHVQRFMHEYSLSDLHDLHYVCVNGQVIDVARNC